MSEQTTELVVLMTRGTDHELSSVAFTIANGAISSGMKVYAFLTSASVDLVRKRAVDTTQVNPMDPLKSLIDDFLKRGGTIWACPPCVKARGYAPSPADVRPAGIDLASDPCSRLLRS